MLNLNFQFIQAPADFERALVFLRQASLITFDIEFVRRSTFYPKFALLQLYDGEQVYIVDPLSVDIKGLLPILEDSSIEKWAHAGFEDIECLFHELGVHIHGLMDSQIAAGFLGHATSLGYSAMVEQELGVHVPKEMTRSNWLQRPLSDKQLDYAAADVYYLWQICSKWREQLKQLGHYDKVAQESASLADINRFLPNTFNYMSEMRGLGGVTDDKLLIQLANLIEWRDALVREMDKPRKFIASDGTLLELVKRQIPDSKGLHAIQDLHPAVIRRHGDKMLTLMQSPLTFADSVPAYVKGIPKKGKLGLCLNAAKDAAIKVAKQNNIASELIINRKLLHSWVKYRLGWYPHLPDYWCQWRQDMLLVPLDAVWKNMMETP